MKSTINTSYYRLGRLLTFIVTFPFVTFLILKPTVGIMSSVKSPD